MHFFRTLGNSDRQKLLAALLGRLEILIGVGSENFAAQTGAPSQKLRGKHRLVNFARPL